MIIIFHISAVEHQQATFTIAGIFSFYYASVKLLWKFVNTF